MRKSDRQKEIKEEKMCDTTKSSLSDYTIRFALIEELDLGCSIYCFNTLFLLEKILYQTNKIVVRQISTEEYQPNKDEYFIFEIRKNLLPILDYTVRQQGEESSSPIKIQGILQSKILGF